MTNNIFPVFETVEFIRVVHYGEGKLGKYAVAIVRRDQNEHTTLFAEEQFPLEQVNVLKEGQIIKVRPSEYGLRAVLKDQDIKLIAQNTEDIAIEVCHLKDKVDGFENRFIEWRNADEKRTNTRFDYLVDRIEKLSRVIVCAYASDENV
tara:strand:- start:198 stop:644 length:447 start_codon:yes stop_codon:yes gene_type:complete